MAWISPCCISFWCGHSNGSKHLGEEFLSQTVSHCPRNPQMIVILINFIHSHRMKATDSHSWWAGKKKQHFWALHKTPIKCQIIPNRFKVIVLLHEPQLQGSSKLGTGPSVNQPYYPQDTNRKVQKILVLTAPGIRKYTFKHTIEVENTGRKIYIDSDGSGCLAYVVIF